jgi:hypothetical protein
MAHKTNTKYQVEALHEGWKILDKYVSLEEAIKIKRWRESHGETARINPMSRSDPSYLLYLGEEEATKVADELVRTNPAEAARGEVLTAEQCRFLLRQRIDHLTKTGKIPAGLASYHLEAFVEPFTGVLRHRGLL